MKSKIIIATHKEYDMPKEDVYLPVFVGSALSNQKLPYQRDDDGENISRKNRSYCELTGLYWAYKNYRADFLGLCHYRRYFNLRNVDMERHTVILPKKRHYYIETVYDQFGHAHGFQALDIVREIIKKDHKEYLECFDACMKRRSLHIYNMFIMRYDVFLKYCDFIFDILFKLEKQMGDVDRLYGYVAERLMDVFIDTNRLEYIETGIIETEKIDWFKKIFVFLKRKYSGKTK